MRIPAIELMLLGLRVLNISAIGSLGYWTGYYQTCVFDIIF